ncbi:MAG: glutamyl endopeptidase [Acidobacteriota bacterium]|jgi:V8-like Glu-specific endopeptidase|nr:glutamyl endopeptidase [Acidobacteriota bacterium]
MKTSDLINTAIRQLPDMEVMEDYLKSEPADVAKGFASGQLGMVPKAIVRPTASFESLAPSGITNGLESARDEVRERAVDAGRRAISKIRKKGAAAKLDREEARGLEAIILLVGRPAILIQDGKFFPPPKGWEILERLRPNIEQSFNSIGRIEVTGHPAGMDWIGTGFLVSDNVIMTNRHVAKEFCRMADAKKWEFEPGMTARIDYNEQFGATESAEFALTGIIGVHEKYDMALFKVALKSSSKAKPPKALPIASSVPKVTKGRKVYVVGYPASDSRRNDPDEMRRIFSNIYDVKRLQPGEFRKIIPKDNEFEHDCSTLGGNSGSCVVDLDTNQVVGLHFSGSYLKANRAVALWELVGDPLLKKAKVNFV